MVAARLAADVPFRAETGELHPAGDSQRNYVEYSLIESGNGRLFPASVIDTNTDSSNPNSTYTLYLVNSRGKEVGTVFERWVFDASLGLTVTYGKLEAHNVNRVPLRDDQSYSKVQTDLLIADIERALISGEVSVENYLSLSDAITASVGKKLVIGSQIVLTTDIDLSTCAAVEFTPSGMIIIPSNYYLKMPASVIAGRWQIFNCSGSRIKQINVVSGGTGYTNGQAVAISGGSGSGATATAVVSGGVIASVIVANGGSGYKLSSSIPSASASGGTGAVLSPIVYNPVEFQSGYPDEFYPEWFGAVSGLSVPSIAIQDATLDAYFYCQGAMATRVDGLPLGGTISNRAAQNYYLSSTLRIHRNVRLYSRGGERGGGALVFPVNTKGVILDRFSTQTGYFDIQQGYSDDAQLENITLVAVSTQTYPTVVNVSGNTVTWVSGVQFDVTAYHKGDTLTIDGYDYVIENVDSAAQITLGRQQLVLRGVSATVLNNLNAGQFSNDWTGATLHIYSAYDPITMTVPVTNFTVSSSTANGGFGSGTITTSSGSFVGGNDYSGQLVMTGVLMSNKQARLNIYHAIDVRSQVTLREVTVNNFHGNGYNLNTTQTPSFDSGSEPNVNNCQLENVKGYGLSGNGIFARGVNSNNMTIMGGDFTNIHGVGVYEASLLGNTYIGVHVSVSYQPSYLVTPAGVNVSTLLNCYAEGGSPPNRPGGSMRIIGGVYGNAWILTNPDDNAVVIPLALNEGSTVPDSWIRQGGTLTSVLKQATRDITFANNGMNMTTEAFLFCDASGGATGVNLPAASTSKGQFRGMIKTDLSANAASFTPQGSDLIGGGGPVDLTKRGEMIILFSDGSANWRIVSHAVGRAHVLIAGTAPAAPPSGVAYFYMDSADNKVKLRDSAGVIVLT